MSNRQADALHREVLGAEDPQRLYVTLKPVTITPKQLKKLSPGDLIEGWDPLHLRIVQGDRVLARAKLGQVGGLEAILIVTTKPETLPLGPTGKHHLLEARLRKFPDQKIETGDVVEYREPLSNTMLLLADRRPVAAAKIVEYDGEPMVRVTEVYDV